MHAVICDLAFKSACHSDDFQSVESRFDDSIEVSINQTSFLVTYARMRTVFMTSDVLLSDKDFNKVWPADSRSLFVEENAFVYTD